MVRLSEMLGRTCTPALTQQGRKLGLRGLTILKRVKDRTCEWGKAEATRRVQVIRRVRRTRTIETPMDVGRKNGACKGI